MLNRTSAWKQMDCRTEPGCLCIQRRRGLQNSVSLFVHNLMMEKGLGVGHWSTESTLVVFCKLPVKSGFCWKWSLPKFQDIIAFLDLMEMVCNLSLVTVWPCSGGDVSWSKHGRSSKCCSWGCSLVMQSLSVIAELFTITYPKILNCIVSHFFKINFIFRQQQHPIYIVYIWGCFILIYEIFIPFSIASWRHYMILVPNNDEISCKNFWTYVLSWISKCIYLNTVKGSQ